MRVDECPHRTANSESDQGPVSTCQLISGVVGITIAVGRVVCEQCLLDGDTPSPPIIGGSDIRSAVARRTILSLAGNHKSDARLLKRCGRTRQQLIEECRVWGYSDGEIAASLLRGRQIAQEVVGRGGAESEVVQLNDIGSAARSARLFENG